jgi:hypothetical protein
MILQLLSEPHAAGRNPCHNNEILSHAINIVAFYMICQEILSAIQSGTGAIVAGTSLLLSAPQ